MTRKVTGDYIIDSDNYQMVVSYVYYYECELYENKESRELEVVEVWLQSKDKNGIFVATDITDLYWDFIEADFIEDIEKEAHEKVII